MLSICISHKNRSSVKTKDGKVLPIFQNCIDSIVKAVKNLDIEIEIVIADYNSTDYPLNEWIYDKIENIPHKIISLGEEKFSKGRSLNIAAENATGEYLFFLDADMIIDFRVLIKGMWYLIKGKVFFPICFSYRDHTHVSGWWRTTGTGNAFILKDAWEQTKVPEYFSWGKEDIEFMEKIATKKTLVREKCQGLFHQWHPIEKASMTYFFQKSE
ncbi:MAG: glycosyltransferase family 2 protein [Marinilabiliaceae bacterium]|nr:glycosyltransferase family 2 protein [Marinilabiliaceae bacterium]